MRSYLAIATTVAFGTRARIVVESVTAGSPVLARVRLAFIDVELAPLSTVTIGAMADELAHAIFTTSAVHARI